MPPKNEAPKREPIEVFQIKFRSPQDGPGSHLGAADSIGPNHGHYQIEYHPWSRMFLVTYDRGRPGEESIFIPIENVSFWKTFSMASAKDQESARKNPRSRWYVAPREKPAADTQPTILA